MSPLDRTIWYEVSAAQVGAANVVVMQEFLARAAQGDIACLHHVAARGDGKRHLRVLLDQQDRGACLVQILDNLEKLLNDNRYLEGNEITEEDKRLYDILIRFDAVYYFKQRLNRKALRDYDNLWNYAKELYSIPEYKEFADFEKIKQEELLGTKEENPYQIVGLGPDESYWNEPNNIAEKFA